MSEYAQKREHKDELSDICWRKTIGYSLSFFILPCGFLFSSEPLHKNKESALQEKKLRRFLTKRTDSALICIAVRYYSQWRGAAGTLVSPKGAAVLHCRTNEPGKTRVSAALFVFTRRIASKLKSTKKRLNRLHERSGTRASNGIRSWFFLGRPKPRAISFWQP